jgi:hypothetical protein
MSSIATQGQLLSKIHKRKTTDSFDAHCISAIGNRHVQHAHADALLICALDPTAAFRSSQLASKRKTMHPPLQYTHMMVR